MADLSMKDRIATWAPPVVSVIALLIFAMAYLIAYLSKDNQTLVMMAGAAITMATQAINFWTGSSSGSQKKDDQQAAALERSTQALATSVPVAAAAAAPVVNVAAPTNQAP